MGLLTESFKGQKYDKIRKDLLKADKLFTDPEFPPAQKSLFFSKTDAEIVWKRPTVSGEGSHLRVLCSEEITSIEWDVLGSVEN